ncbi:hypothetical protein SeMB42_g03385 [Synchytrium endobioticum]|uniref:Cytochrome P450 n=1 Tax=Synchytrium endobioticum TaxID=286115 RepID=A0A507D710_9FUNG|nr:hypothetical protein SeMB42_g03385 [Synchytrium endobioticum]
MRQDIIFSTAAVVCAGVGVYLWTTLKKNKIPGPTGLPFVGALYEMLPYAREGRLHEFFHEMVKKYGPIFNLPLPGGQEMVVIADAKIARALLFNRVNGRVEKSDEFQKHTVLKQGMIALFGDQHKVHRKHLVNAFIPTQLNQTVEASCHYASQLMDLWKAQSPDGHPITVDIYKCMMAMTTDVLGRILFSYEFKALDRLSEIGDRSTFEAAMDMLTIAPAKRAGKPEFLWHYFGVSQDQVKEALKPVYDLLGDVINEKRAVVQQNGGKRQGQARDLVDLLLESDPETGKDKFSTREIVDEAATFYIGGHDTTASTLTWTFYELVQRPDVIAQLQEEIDNMLATGSPLDNIFISHFKYLDYVFSEILRLHPPTVMTNWRKAMTDLEDVRGYRITAGTRIMIAIREIQRSPEYWPDAEDFKPERWANLKPGNEYLPFSDGEYKCIGHKMATMEVKATLVAILSKYTPRFVPNQNSRGIYAATLALKNGYKVELVERRSRS